MPITFESLKNANKLRCERHFHKLEVWEPWDWTNAMAGEVGEACNITKKLNRLSLDSNQKGNWDKLSEKELIINLAKEIADVVIYADLLATRMGFELQEIVQQKFNEKSFEIGSNITL